MARENNANLSATYTSPTNEPFTITNSLPSTSSSSVADKTQYLGALRQAISSTQDQINQELTARMEEDKSRAAADVSASTKSAAVDDAKEEENYGEEVQEEDD